jgi:hypothetical protein
MYRLWRTKNLKSLCLKKFEKERVKNDIQKTKNSENELEKRKKEHIWNFWREKGYLGGETEEEKARKIVEKGLEKNLVDCRLN